MQTEVGVIPDDWQVKLLPEVCKFRGGKAHEQHISDLGRYVCVNSKFISSDGAVRKYSSANFCPAKKGDVLMVMSDLPSGRALAKAYLVEADDTYAVNQRVCALSTYRDSPEYLFYVLNRNPYFLKFDDGVNHTHLLNPVFEKCPLTLPPTVEEQHAIAAALSDVDALLSGLDRLIAKKRDLKQAAMQQLLTGQTRLPGFHGVWEVKTLGELATIKDGTHQTPKYVPFGVPFFSVEHVTSGDFTNTKFISTEEHRLLTRSFHIERDDILMTRIGSIGDCKLIDWDVEASFYVSLALLKTRRGYSAAFIAQYSNTTAFKKEIELHSLPSAIPKKINLGPISNIRIELPPTLPEQTAIAAVLSDMDTELSALEARRDKTRDLKQAMMQELLTGKTRLVPVGAAHA
jgi:type I restriction enzyme S subunit